MRAKANNNMRTKNMALQVAMHYHIVSGRNSFEALGRKISYVNITEEDARKSMKN